MNWTFFRELFGNMYIQKTNQTKLPGCSQILVLEEIPTYQCDIFTFNKLNYYIIKQPPGSSEITMRREIYIK